MSITAHEATGAAMRFLADLSGGTVPMHTALEEIERQEDGRYWHVTLGWPRNPDPLQPFFGRPKPEDLEYKTFKISDATGEVVSMKIRKP